MHRHGDHPGRAGEAVVRDDGDLDFQTLDGGLVLFDGDIAPKRTTRYEIDPVIDAFLANDLVLQA